MINHGRIIADGALKQLVDAITPHRYLVVESTSGLDGFVHPHAEVIRCKDEVTWIRFARDKVSASQLIGELSARYEIRDVSVQEPDIENVVRRIYTTPAATSPSQ